MCVVKLTPTSSAKPG